MMGNVMGSRDQDGSYSVQLLAYRDSLDNRQGA